MKLLKKMAEEKIITSMSEGRRLILGGVIKVDGKPVTDIDAEVTLKPLETYLQDADAKVGRMSIDKKFSGDLEGSSKGEMLSAMTAVQGSAGYVAIELVTGTLHGNSGTFVLQHASTMSRGVAEQSVTVQGLSALEWLSSVATSPQVQQS